jgi:hypothetical protein
VRRGLQVQGRELLLHQLLGAASLLINRVRNPWQGQLKGQPLHPLRQRLALWIQWLLPARNLAMRL